MNRIEQVFASSETVMSIYFTAGYPQLQDTVDILKLLQDSGADMAEIGMPFSDPLADGPVIQQSGQKALENGMSVRLLIKQLAHVRDYISIPLILMGYFNNIYHYGVESFLKKAREAGIDALIIPDLPLEEYLEKYRPLFERYAMPLIFLVTPQTSEERIKQMDKNTTAFLYLVTANGLTGSTGDFSDDTWAYFERVRNLRLRNRLMGGFGISNARSFAQVGAYLDGGIIGSAFIRAISADQPLAVTVPAFVKSLRGL